MELILWLIDEFWCIQKADPFRTIEMEYTFKMRAITKGDHKHIEQYWREGEGESRTQERLCKF